MDKDLIITRMSNSSWFKLSIMGLEIHLDPGYGGLYENQGFKESDINVCDYILISHEHKDHMRSEVIEKLCGHKTKMIVSKSCEKELMFSHQVVLPNEKIMLKDFQLETIYAYNTEKGHSTKKFHLKDTYLGFILTFGDFRIYFAGDTDITDEMRSLKNINLAFLPIGGTYVMDLDEAIEATMLIKPRYVVPMHQASRSLLDFKHKLSQVSDSESIVLYPGESYKISVK